MKIGQGEFARWLKSLGLGRYAATFAAHDVDFDALGQLTDADLKELGLSLGHRRKLQAAVEDRNPRAAGRVRPASESPGVQGERRQITVMFCDLVGSSELSVRFDPEDLRNLIHTYYSACCRIVEESGGFVARIVGDGILAYFGYPKAREDAAECAIRASLRIVESVRREWPDGADRIDVRIGLATGVSVIGDMVGIGFSELHSVMGQTPNLASRIQSLVEPGMVAVADETRRLAGGFFVYADHGNHRLRGFEQPVQVWLVTGESRSNARFNAQHSARIACVGRDAQLSVLQQAWGDASGGRCRVVWLQGEAGIGKSRLLHAASENFLPAPGVTVFMQNTPSQSTTPLHPVVDWLRRDIGIAQHAATDDRARLQAWLGDDATSLDLGLLAELLTVTLDGEQPPRLPPDRKRLLTREVVLRHFERCCAAAPVLLMVEDAHWMDGATRLFLAALIERIGERCPMLLLVTARPGADRSWAAGATGLQLEPLPPADTEKLIRSVCRGRTMPATMLDEILRKTDGVPLFVEELTAMILESGLLREEDDALVMDGPLPALDIPSTLRDSLMARLDRLSDIKDVARIASAIGREFSFSLLAQVSRKPQRLLAAALDRLVDAQLLFQRGVPPHADYVFKHALVQQAAYDSQLRSDRLALHAGIVEAIEAHHPQIAKQEPGLMAHHCELAGMADREVDYLYAAGLASTRIVAIPEALSYFNRADAVVSGLEPTERNVRRNIDIILGLMEVGRFAILPSRLRELSERARKLSGMDGGGADASVMAAILFQEGRTRLYSSQYAQARSIFQQIRRLGIDNDSLPIERKPASAFGMDLCCQGLFGETLAFINEDNIGYYRESGSFIDYISGLGWIAYASCQTGAVETGLRCGQLSVSEAEQVQSQIYLAGAYIWRSHAMMAVRRYDEAVSDAQLCVTLSTAHAVPYLGWHGLVFLALCQCRSGDTEAATQSLAQARVLLSQVEDGQWSLLDYLPAIEAEIACLRGEHETAIRLADQAIALAGSIGGHFAEAMAWRVKALCSIGSGAGLDDAQSCFDHALARFEQGDAHAERAFSSLVWAHALQQAGQVDAARRWVAEAKALAQRHGLDLQRCENGAAVALAG